MGSRQRWVRAAAPPQASVAWDPRQRWVRAAASAVHRGEARVRVMARVMVIARVKVYRGVS
jgi:alkanesulfonate monooxygenase SsuD/methylene tetrahydromethanopterin reductase-like flavin-dependent oxidoreductase (luciferase family)